MRLQRLAAILAVSLSATGPALAEPSPVTEVSPTYPAAAASAGVEGDATVLLSVAPDGTVMDVGLIRETPPGYGFGAAAIDATRQWRFVSPTFEGGKYVVTLKFELEQAAPGAVERGTGLPKAPQPLKRGKLAYPQEAYVRSENGSVTLALTIAGDGSVSDVEVLSERPRNRGFGRAAREAIAESRYASGIAGRYATVIHFGVLSDDDFALVGKTRRQNVAPAPEPLGHVAPVYPPNARKKAVEADVLLAVFIDDQGVVKSADIAFETVTGEGFGAAAARAIKEWTYPANTQPGLYQVEVPFRLKD